MNNKINNLDKVSEKKFKGYDKLERSVERLLRRILDRKHNVDTQILKLVVKAKNLITQLKHEEMLGKTKFELKKLRHELAITLHQVQLAL